MDLLAFKNLSQLLAIQPCAEGTLVAQWLTSASSSVNLRKIQFVGVLEQRPAHALEFRVSSLLLAAYRIKRFGRIGDDVKLVEVTRALGRCSSTPLMNASEMWMPHGSNLLRRAVVLAKVARKALDRLRVTARCDENDAPSLHIGNQRQILMAAPVRSLVNGDRAHVRQVRKGQREFHVVRTVGMQPVDASNIAPLFRAVEK